MLRILDFDLSIPMISFGMIFIHYCWNVILASFPIKVLQPMQELLIALLDSLIELGF